MIKKILAIICSLIGISLLFFWWRADFALPIFCTTRGCVSTAQRDRERTYQQEFANAANTSSPSEEAILTSLVRRHLILHTQNSTNDRQQAVRYRTDILHLTDISAIQQVGFSSFEEYDDLVTIPFLLQQAYMSEHSLQTPEEAYIDLSEHFRVVPLIFGYTWDTSKGEVKAK